eukprot:CAMPEP_0178414300 /NCGR_PEP_ID=MMETSP0689_2-20121128/22966_1 /TAXON_ID=160604 /ORGANISM="Amphidinium massartii, Strain CS-259" /LENGTH=382 /DNA_ID=CAMNT_0020035587 /DNA_START=123 /DNA_END=1268 /DNA_ORIENTATION=+
MAAAPGNSREAQAADTEGSGDLTEVIAAVRQSLEDYQAVQALEWHSGWHVEHLGGRGITCGYDAESGCFHVRASPCPEKQQATDVMKVHPKDMLHREWEDSSDSVKLQASRSEQSESETEASVLSSAQSLFSPGSMFAGTIAIPGMTQQDEDDGLRKQYTLEVLSESLDEFGQPQLLAQHAAYGDLQACHIDFRTVSTGSTCKVEVSYADSETFCEGTLDIETGKVSGKVNQLVQGEEGFFEPSAEVTHTFELVAVQTTAPAVEAAHQIRCAAARTARVRGLCSAMRTLHRNRELESVLLEVPWKEVFDDAERLCELRCATLRRLSKLLDSLQFDTVERKESALRLLAQKKVTRAAFHKSSDEDVTLLAQLLTAMPPGLRVW